MRLIQKAEIVDTENKTKFPTPFAYKLNFCYFCLFCLFWNRRGWAATEDFLRSKQTHATFHSNQNKNSKLPRFQKWKKILIFQKPVNAKSEEQIFVKVRGFVPRFCLGSRSLLLQPLTKKGVLEQIIVDKWHSLWSKRDWRDIGLLMQGGQSQHYQDSKRRTWEAGQ